MICLLGCVRTSLSLHLNVYFPAGWSTRVYNVCLFSEAGGVYSVTLSPMPVNFSTHYQSKRDLMHQSTHYTLQ